MTDHVEPIILFEEREDVTVGGSMEKLIQEAEYEVNQDPYRGIIFLGSVNDKKKETDGEVSSNSSAVEIVSTMGEREKIVSPWDICQWGILSLSKNTIHQKFRQNDGSFELDPKDPNTMVQHLTESKCPSILAWTKQYLEGAKKSPKTRKRTGNKLNRSQSSSVTLASLGQRPLDCQYRCPCDSNPFCLASLGGFMNQLLLERYQKSITVVIDCNKSDDNNNDSDVVNSKNKRAGVFRHNNNNGNSKIQIEEKVVALSKSKDQEELEENSGVFAFMNDNNNVKKRTETKPLSSTSFLTCKRLGPAWSKPEIGDPADIFRSREDIKNQHLNETEYSITTKDEIDSLRGCQEIDLSKIRHYVQKFVEVSNCDKMTIDGYIRAINEWHKSLIFVNPTSIERDVGNNCITIALPPGIQNLGATCYLNTQLQCLAQNPVFLNGIFSWRAVNSSHNMNGVMTKLQKLLAHLVVGANGKYTSLDFSNALGLQHNEQQDPNEFARLLFDRMEESFQQCSGEVGTGGDDLGRLLQRIFHGTTTYETTCMECDKISVRSEGFMDLNLPIVRRKQNEENDTNISDGSNNIGKEDVAVVSKRKRLKTGTIKQAFKKCVDTDVQYCLDQYTKAEMLDGDNKYFCDYCKCKQNAKRAMILTELPPVLNIQLSRYVFDREKFVKKKLMDKVRLPTVLNIDRYGDSSCSRSKTEPAKKKYVLCAVMRHQGTSAYSGHYVAEAMDWTTGQWYEFNDENVKVLSEPSSSYVPRIFMDKPIVNRDGITENIKSFWNTTRDDKVSTAGSQDAYNMYYVDEEYLFKNAADTVYQRQSLNYMWSSADHGRFNGDDDVLSHIIREKENKYKILTESCFEDYVASDRLRRRRDGIQKYMFVDPSSMLVQEGQKEGNDEPYFWVDGDAFRQFLACDLSLDDKLRSNKPIVCPETLLCLHGRLHPRNARRGKLLRKSLYDSYVSLLKGELKLLSETSEVNDNDVVGCVITPNRNMSCVECSKQYCNELTKKLEFIKNVYDLYAHLKDEKTYQYESKFVKSEICMDSTTEEYLYILSRTTITTFLGLVDKLTKSAEGFNKGANLVNKSTFLNGIDDIDICVFPGSPTFVGSKMQDPGSTSNLDDKFNTKLTCPHGNCTKFSKNSVRYVPYKTWAIVKKVFPHAFELKLLIHSKNDEIRKPSSEHDGCKICRKELDGTKNLLIDIKNWVKNTKNSPVLEKVLDKKRVSGGETVVHNFACMQSGCRLVHCDDIVNFCRSVKSLASKALPETIVGIKSLVEKNAFPSYHAVVLDFEKQANEKFLQSIRSLICCEHKLTIKNAIVDCCGEDEDSQNILGLSNCVAVLSAEEYNAYINSLTKLLSILNCDYQNHHIIGHSLPDDTSTLIDEVKLFVDSCHPTIEIPVKQNTPSDEVLRISVDGNSKEFSIVPGICYCEACIKEFVPLLQNNNSDIEDTVESVSDDSSGGRKKEMCGWKDHKTGSIAMDPIVVESDFEDYTELAEHTQKIKIFQYKDDSELDDALRSLRSAAGLSSNEINNGLEFGLRRSKRKRKTSYPIGCITLEQTIDIGLHHNIAALRLLLFQNCQIPLKCKISIAVTLNDISPPRGLEIAYDWSSKTLQDLIDELKNFEGISDFSTSNPSENIFLLYQNEKDGELGDIEATIMDSLLQISNIISPDSDNKSGKGWKSKRNRASERGFQGTLLQSSTSPAAEFDAQNGANLSDTSCQIEASTEVVTNKVESRSRSHTVEISEDENGIESEEEQHIIQTKVIHPIMKETSSDSSDGVQASSPLDDDRKMKFVGQLKDIASSQDESACFEAVTWAIANSNLDWNEKEILDAAFAKFLETNLN